MMFESVCNQLGVFFVDDMLHRLDLKDPLMARCNHGIFCLKCFETEMKATHGKLVSKV